MMTNSEVLVSNFESGAWVIYEIKVFNLEEPKVENPNLEDLEVENDTSNAIHILRNHYSRQSVDPDASMERDSRCRSRENPRIRTRKSFLMTRSR